MHLWGSLFWQDQQAIGSLLTCCLVYQCFGIRFQGRFSKDSRLLQLWAQILVPVIFLSFAFPILGLLSGIKRSHCLVAPSSPEVIEAAAHICVITQLACSACSVLWLLSPSGWRKKCCFWMPLSAAASPGEIFGYGNERGLIARESHAGQGRLLLGAELPGAGGHLGRAAAGLGQLSTGARGCETSLPLGFLCSRHCLGNCCLLLLLCHYVCV